jgi:hypothetical protein
MPDILRPVRPRPLDSFGASMSAISSLYWSEGWLDRALGDKGNVDLDAFRQLS